MEKEGGREMVNIDIQGGGGGRIRRDFVRSLSHGRPSCLDPAGHTGVDLDQARDRAARGDSQIQRSQPEACPGSPSDVGELMLQTQRDIHRVGLMLGQCGGRWANSRSTRYNKPMLF